MPIPRRHAIVAAIVVASSATALLASCGGTTLNLTVKNTTRVKMDMAAPGPSMGDMLAVDGEVLDGGTVVGDSRLNAAVAESGTTTEVRGTTLYFVWRNSPDSLVMAGAPVYRKGGGLPERPMRFAVVGGTGQYAGVGGEAIGTMTKPGLFDFQISLN